MSFRQDKLVVLLETGTSQQVRRTAAKQLADLSSKTFSARPKREQQEERVDDSNNNDVKLDIDFDRDPQRKSEFSSGMDSKPDIQHQERPVRLADTKPQLPIDADKAQSSTTLDKTEDQYEFDAWSDALETIAKITPLLFHKSSETRHAAAYALGLLATQLPSWSPPTCSDLKPILLPSPIENSSTPLDVPSILRRPTLLASAGREYIAKPSAGDRAKRRKAMMGSIGLGDAVGGWGEEVDKVIGEDEDEGDGEGSGTGGSPTRALSGQQQQQQSTQPPKDIFEGLSARQITMLKRKKGDIVEEANKMRRLNAKTSGSSDPPTRQSSPTNADLQPGKEISNGDPASTSTSSNVVVIDPGRKVEPTAPPIDNKPTLHLVPGHSPWSVVVLDLVPRLTDPKWEVRHGAALGLMEVIRSTGENLGWGYENFLIGVARQLLQLLALDRFGDFLGDTVMAPVRETAAQALGVTMKFLDIQEDKEGGSRAIREVHETLMSMVRQPWARRGQNVPPSEKFAWEVRHAGLLGLKYQVAVRPDLLSSVLTSADSEFKPDIESSTANLPTEGQRTMLDDVIAAAILALGEVDDDVRSVAASALLPITSHLTSPQLIDKLWDCLAEGGDELGSSTGAVMDLVGALLEHEAVIAIMADPTNNRPQQPPSAVDQVISVDTDMSKGSEGSSTDRSRRSLISRIYPFMRHTIASVRLAVAKALYVLITVPGLPRNDWLDLDVCSLLFQNLILEERPEIRDVSFNAFSAALPQVLTFIDSTPASETLSSEGLRITVSRWYALAMTVPGNKLEEQYFVRKGKRSSGHDVDKPMVAGDLSLVSMDTIYKTRIISAKALALVPITAHDVVSYISSGVAHQVFLSAVIIQEMVAASANINSADRKSSLPPADALIAYISSPPPQTYFEMAMLLTRLQNECRNLFSALTIEGKVNKDRIPDLPTRVDPLGAKGAFDVFTLDTAHQAVGPTFDALIKLIKPAGKGSIPILREKQRKVVASIGFYGVYKERYDVQVAASVAGAIISLGEMPPKLGGVIKAVMDGIKKEENELLQQRAAESLAQLIKFCTSPAMEGRPNPVDKVMKNLFTFLNSDTSVTPIFGSNGGGGGGMYDGGIVSLREENSRAAAMGGGTGGGPGRRTGGVAKEGTGMVEETEEQITARIMRRGAQAALSSIAKEFGSDLFTRVVKFWEGLSAPLLLAPTPEDIESRVTNPPSSTSDAGSTPSKTSTFGQDLIDSLTSLRLLVPTLHSTLHPTLLTLFPALIASLQTPYPLIRNAASKAIASICQIVTVDAMRIVVEDVVPLIGDAKRVTARQGAVETVYHVINLLDIKALPYVLFLIVPILGRMSDPDEHVRLLSTSTFAALIKMVPLEAGIPDPAGFSPEMLAKRDEERQFLMQLLDGSKAEQYKIPIEIKAELRQYQKDGVSWLAFLAKYQLHGILCDDMGLGKSLQTICIIGSKHYERSKRHQLTNSVDSAHLPSLIVCPPTLTGHWFYEIQKFTETSTLRPIQYVGSAAERIALRPHLTSHDVIITSYEIVRNDIDFLGGIDWLYCVLDEGHVIKNSKTKLSQAVKQIRAQHRLLLSGTPIQNNVLELWSLFDFLMPGFLGTERGFNEKFSKPILADRDGKATAKEREQAATALEALHKQVLPFLLRRLKEDVLNDLPPKIIQDYYCELSDIQKVLYDEFSKSRAAEEAGEEIYEADGVEEVAGKKKIESGQQHVFQSLQYLRKLCNHPALVLQGQGKQGMAAIAEKVGGHLPPITDISHAPKLEALRQLLTDCGIGLPATEKLDPDNFSSHRVLIFCQLRPMLDLIERDLFKQHMPLVSYMRMDGSTDPKRRHAIVQTFNADPRIDVLLLTTSVGGLGLNLTGADTVIFVDHDWNPMKDLQAMDRAHRLGQKKVVNVYRLITRGTLEEKIMGLQRFKLNIASSVVTQQNASLGSMNTGEVLDLFKVSSEPAGAVGSNNKSGGKVGGSGHGAGGVGGMTSKILEGLEDLPPEDEYAELSLDNFLSKI